MTKKLWIAGLGPGGTAYITAETLQIIQQAEKVILRTEMHPAATGLSAMGISYESCDRFYESGGSFPEIYEKIAQYVIETAMMCASVCFCVPGHPLVAEDAVHLLLRKAKGLFTHDRSMEDDEETENEKDVYRDDISIEVLPALSFLDAAFVLLGLDPVQDNFTILDAAKLIDGDRTGILPLPAASCLFAQVYHQLIASELKLALLEALDPDAEIFILYHAGVDGEEELVRCPLAELDHFKDFDHLTSVFLPQKPNTGQRSWAEVAEKNRLNKEVAGVTSPAMEGAARYPLDPLVGVFRRLLGPEGCPWDREQTHTSLKPYLLEEANEALEAIDEKDMEHLREELGDVLMQIVFHCALAEMQGAFDINDVIDGITEKMIRRHPHVFGDAKADNPDEVAELWQKIKEEEKTNKNIEA